MRTSLFNPAGRIGAHKSRGQALIYVTVCLLTLISFAALATDTGMLWVNRRALQNAADAAALAGAQELMEPDGPAQARAVACDYALVKNAVPDMTVDCSGQGAAISEPCDPNVMPSVDMLVCQTYVPGDSIRVITNKTVDPMFGRAQMPPWESTDINAYAIAMVGSLHTVCVFPIFQTQDLLEASGAWGPDGPDSINYGVPVIMKTSTDDAESGNFMALQVDGSSSKDAWRDTVGSPDGCSGETSETATTSTGNFVGAFDQGMADRAALWNDPASPGYCPDLTPTIVDGQAVHPQRGGIQASPDNCYRLVQVPLLAGTSTDYNGTTEAEILGFLTFYISNWCGQLSDPQKGTGSDPQHCASPGYGLEELKFGELWGYYLRFDAVSGSINPYDGLGTKVVLLKE